MAAQGKIQKALRRVSGRKPMPVFNPRDIERLRSETVDLKPFPVEEAKEEKSLARRPSQDGTNLFAQLLADRLGSPQAVPLERKVFLNLDQASEYTSRGCLREGAKSYVKRVTAGSEAGRNPDSGEDLYTLLAQLALGADVAVEGHGLDAELAA